MSEESSANISCTEKDEHLENEAMKDNDPNPTLPSDESPSTESENAEESTDQEHTQENRQPTEPVQSEAQNSSDAFEPLNNNAVLKDSTSEQKLTESESSSETKPSEEISDVSQPPASSDMSMSQVPSSDKVLEEVSENIQLIYEGLKDMTLSSQDNPGLASGKKGRKPASTPRARSTPVKPLTSPPLTRSRSRDLRKVPSTPLSPTRKNSEGDSDEIRVRGRQRVKKN